MSTSERDASPRVDDDHVERTQIVFCAPIAELKYNSDILVILRRTHTNLIIIIIDRCLHLNNAMALEPLLGSDQLKSPK